jgi:uncharacterized membrane protein YkoI
MKKIFALLGIFIFSIDFALAQCGVHRQQVESKQRSSVVVPEEEKSYKKYASIPKKEAKKIAVSQYPGKVKKADLVVDEGTLVWKLEVKGEEGQKELFVDPANGTFLGYGLTK